MNEQRNGSAVLWLTVVASLLLLYVLSSGPMQTVAFTRHTNHSTGADGRVSATSAVEPGKWWPKVYAPLVRACQESWGAPLLWYWGLFPIR